MGRVERAWRVDVRGPGGATEVIEAQFVVSAVGSLNLPHVPDIPGMDTFAGQSFHSARWPDDLDISGKRFALVGAGASGFQIAPSIADAVAQLSIYQRTAQWMFPNPLYRTTVPAGDRWALLHLPFYARWFRFMMTYPGISVGTTPYRRDPDYPDADGMAINAGNAARREELEAWICSHLEGRPDLIEKSIPNYPASGKRILQDDGFWLRALCKPNVELVRTAIDRIVPEGVVTEDGTLREADVICYATGFRHNEFLAPMEVTGRDGISLREQWGDEPTAYLGVTVPNFPNLFCLYGPGTNLAHSSSLFFHSEYQMSHAMDVIHLTLASAAAPRRSAPRRARRLRRMAPAGDQPARVGAPVDRAQPLQEPGRQGVHALTVADRPVLGADARPRRQRLRARLTVRLRRDLHAGLAGLRHVREQRWS